MNAFLHKVKQNCISGTILLIPIYVFYEILQRVWGFFAKYGEITAKILGFDVIFGPIATDILGGMILLILLYFSGYLIRLAFLKQFISWIDDKLMVFIPGYEKNKKMAESKLLNQPSEAPQYLPILLKSGNYWQPAYLIEENPNGEAVVFVPNAPSIEQGQIYVVSNEFIKELTLTTTAHLNESVKSMGKGILNFK